MRQSLIAIGLILVATVVIGVLYTKLGEFESSLGLEEETESAYTSSECTVAGVMLRGELYTYYDPESQMADDIASAEDVAYALQEAEDAPDVSVILLEIDSYGGYPVAAEELATQLRKSISKPVIAQIRGAGTSGAYWVASASDVIFASALSDVGGIGVTSSYLDESILNELQGYTFNELSTGKYKDMGNPEKTLTDEERALIERDLDIIHEAFVNAVVENRNIEVEKVRELADGSTLLGASAKENGLIDEIGGLIEIEEYIRNTYGIEPVICWG